jgi:hypothetical protein
LLGNGYVNAADWRHVPPTAKQPAVMLMPLLIVVEPVLSTEKSVVVADAVDEPMAKRVVLVPPLLAWIDERANGDVVPMATSPVSVMRNFSVPFVEKPILSAAGENMPTFSSPENEYAGAAAVGVVPPPTFR